MTVKRFTLIKNTGTDECYSDNLYDNGTYIGAIEGGSEMICHLLNAQYEENKKLLTLSNMKKGALVEAVKELTEENERLKIKLENVEDARKSYKEDWKTCTAYCDEYKNEIYDVKDNINRLLEENEQLKSNNEEVIDLIIEGMAEMHDGKRDYAETIFNKAIKLLKGDVE